MCIRDSAERGFRLDFAGAKTNRRLFRAAASRPVTDGHESSPDRPQSEMCIRDRGWNVQVDSPGRTPEGRQQFIVKGPAIYAR